MNLYQLDAAIMALVDPETGEIQDWEAFDALQMERDVKVENVACWYKDLVARAKDIRQEELALAERRQALEKMAEKRKKWLLDALAGQKFETARCLVTFRRSTKVELSDEGAAIEWAMANHRDDVLKFKAPELNKNELAKVLKENIKIPGAELVEGLSVGVK